MGGKVPAGGGGVNRRRAAAARVSLRSGRMPGEQAKPAEIFVVSDGTGDTASSATQAAMLQFRTPWRMRTFRDVRQESQARRVIDLAARSGAMVVFTVVDERVARTLRDHGASQGVR